MNLCLTPKELFELTDLRQPAAQRRWLDRRGWEYETGASGQPKISHAYFQLRMAGTSNANAGVQKVRPGIDRAALDAFQHKH